MSNDEDFYRTKYLSLLEAQQGFDNNNILVGPIRLLLSIKDKQYQIRDVNKENARVSDIYVLITYSAYHRKIK